MTLLSRHRGVIVPLVTPVTASGLLDEAAAERLVDHVASNGCGMLVLGTTGEVASLSAALRRRYVEIAVRVTANRTPVFACIAHNCVEDSIAAGRDYLRLGVDAVVGMLPNFFKLDPAGIQNYFERLSDALTGPLIIYNMPQTTGMSIPVEVIERLSRRSNITGLKDSESTEGRRELVAKRLGGRENFSLFMGVASHSVAAMRLGFVGLVPSSGNLYPELWRDLHAVALARDWARAEQLQKRLDAIGAVFQRDRTLGQSLAAIKAGLSLRQLCGPDMLPPLQPLDRAGRAAVCHALLKLPAQPSLSRPPLVVFADDLTGAAEIASIAHNAGLRALVLTTPPGGPADADVLVFDTDTRLCTPARAAQRVRAFAKRLRRQPHSGFFKKTDSVLRGPVLAELTALATSLGHRRTLLVPCNPSLGRVIRDGHYFIGGRPLHETAFVHDPHHPRTTSEVLTLLDAKKYPRVACLAPSSRLPGQGIIVGEADSPADVAVWAGQIDAHTLPAGGADFFRLWLQARRPYSPPTGGYRLPAGPALLLSGTIAPSDPFSPFAVQPVAIAARRIPSVKTLSAKVRAQLRATGCAAVTATGPLVHDARVSTALTRTFASLAAELHAAGAFNHLLIAGGATAAAVLSKLGWSQFDVVRIWGPGAVTLRPTAAPEFAVTMKPGSYAWPASLSQYFQPTASC